MTFRRYATPEIQANCLRLRTARCTFRLGNFQVIPMETWWEYCRGNSGILESPVNIIEEYSISSESSYESEWKNFNKDWHLGVSENGGNCPQIVHFNRIFHYKPSIWGGPPLVLETPTCQSGFKTRWSTNAAANTEPKAMAKAKAWRKTAGGTLPSNTWVIGSWIWESVPSKQHINHGIWFTVVYQPLWTVMFSARICTNLYVHLSFQLPIVIWLGHSVSVAQTSSHCANMNSYRITRRVVNK